jgi:hypothetical protein
VADVSRTYVQYRVDQSLIKAKRVVTRVIVGALALGRQERQSDKRGRGPA